MLEFYPNSAQKILQNLLLLNSEARLTAYEASKNEWFKNNQTIEIEQEGDLMEIEKTDLKEKIINYNEFPLFLILE